MATVNLGRIKPVFRGAYNNSTAYVIDDIVTSGNETFIAIAATQGNATSDASKWTKLAAKGADGTDVAATLANKEISFKTNAGALDGVPIGNAGEFLKVNSGATGYEFGAVSSDFVHIKTQTISSNVNSVQFVHGSSGVIFDNTYKFYKIFLTNLITNTGNAQMRMRFGAGDFTVRTSGYESSGYRVYYDSGGGGNGVGQATTADSLYLLNMDSSTSLSSGHHSGEITIYDPSNSGSKTQYFSNCTGNDGTYSISQFSGGYYNTAEATSGVSFYNQSNSISGGTFSLYGIKS